MTVTEEQREYYDQNGYVIVDSGIPESTLDLIIRELRGIYTGESDVEVDYRDGGRIQDAWKINPNVKTLALNPRIFAILEELYNRKPQAFQTLNFSVGTEQRAHSDTISFNSIPSGYMCGVWTALEDMDENNGTLIFYPGSHKLPEVTLRDVGCEWVTRSNLSPSQLIRRTLRKLGIIKSIPTLKTDDAYPLYVDYISGVIDKNNLKPAYAILKKGQALIWSANLLHGGSPLKEKSRSRHSQVTHYFFEDCQYYTPLVSNSESKAWRNPDWIS